MERIPEPEELMEGQEQALAYARADFSTSNQWFVDHLVAAFPAHLHRVLDLGCGPGDVMIRLARAKPEARITAVDGADEMVRLAREAVAAAGLAERITPVQGYIPGLPLTAGGFDAILSKDLLHHLPDPAVLWQEARRLGRPGAAVFVMDLFRPASPEAARAIVARVAGSEHPVLQEDFFNSLCAAFTADEVRAQLAAAALPLDVAPVSDRHLLIHGLLP
jgi:ubiquinone/menaquinone biosynthesis C-methylase UbiE